MIVVDAALIADLCLDGERTPQAELVLETDPVWVAPALWRSEFGDVLADYLRDRRMSMESVLVSLHMAEETMAGREYAVDMRTVLELAAESGGTAGQCEYVALALDLGVPWVTTDKAMLRAFSQTAVSPAAFTRIKPADKRPGKPMVENKSARKTKKKQKK
jgi:predicted nucleic acid-binding protein